MEENYQPTEPSASSQEPTQEVASAGVLCQKIYGELRKVFLVRTMLSVRCLQRSSLVGMSCLKENRGWGKPTLFWHWQIPLVGSLVGSSLLPI